MNIVNDKLSRQKLQINIYKILISTIVFSAIIFLITNEGLFFDINWKEIKYEIYFKSLYV